MILNFLFGTRNNAASSTCACNGNGLGREGKSIYEQLESWKYNAIQYNTIQYNAKDEKKAFRSPRGYYRGKKCDVITIINNARWGEANDLFRQSVNLET